MAFSLGSHNFACSHHDTMRVQPAPKAELRIEVAGLDGVGKIMLGRRSGLVTVAACYSGYASETALAAAIDADDDVKGGTPATLTVAGSVRSNCQLIGIDPGRMQVDGKNGLWFTASSTLIFEQLNA